MRMRKLLFLLFVFSIGFFCLSCNSKKQQERIVSLTQTLDSLQQITQQQDSSRAILDAYVETIAMTLDSIKINEKILTVQVDERGHRLKKSEIERNLETLADVIKRQRERIEELEKALMNHGIDSLSHYRTIIAHLYAELDAKNQRIAELEHNLQGQTRTIAHLNSRVSALENDMDALSTHAREQAETIAIQTEILNAQNAQLNIGYLFIGNRRELQNAGIIPKNIFGGSKINASELDLSKFVQVDVREFNDIVCKSKHPKILSSHPAGSYSIENTNDGCTILSVKDSGLFWSLSTYLIIQL